MNAPAFSLTIVMLFLFVVGKAQTSAPTPTNKQYIEERNARYAALFKQQQTAQNASSNTKQSNDTTAAADKRLLGTIQPDEKKEPKRVQMATLDMPDMKTSGPKNGK